MEYPPPSSDEQPTYRTVQDIKASQNEGTGKTSLKTKLMLIALMLVGGATAYTLLVVIPAQQKAGQEHIDSMTAPYVAEKETVTDSKKVKVQGQDRRKTVYFDRYNLTVCDRGDAEQCETFTVRDTTYEAYEEGDDYTVTGSEILHEWDPS